MNTTAVTPHSSGAAGLIHAYILDGKGGGTRIGWPEVVAWQPQQGILWVHLDYTSDEAIEWISSEPSINPIAAQALLHEETRPRAVQLQNAILLSLRGVNMNTDANPADMVSIRILLQQDRIISTRKRVLFSVSDLAASIHVNEGPVNSSEFLLHLLSRMTDRIETVVEDLDEQAAQLEVDVMSNVSKDMRCTISAIRRSTIMLRRYLAPQREAMAKLTEKMDWFAESPRLHLREVTDQLIRQIEDLDSIRDRCIVIQEELLNRHTEQMNTRMYVLSLVAALFLPLGFVTGLFGINLGGMPGAASNWGFWIFAAVLPLISLAQIVLFRRNRWL